MVLMALRTLLNSSPNAIGIKKVSCWQEIQANIPSGNSESIPDLEGGFAELVKKPPSVHGQACATTMPACRAGTPTLKSVEIVKAPTLFIGFIFAVDKAGFPRKTLMSVEEEQMNVFKDRFATTRVHKLGYCPDIRSLFTSPKAGLYLLRRMDDAAWEAMKQFYLSNDAWRQKALSPVANECSVDDLRPHVIGAFNLPPSQEQPHLQYMLPPLLPQHVSVYKKGNTHFVKMRHFPFAYVVAGLQALDKAGASILDATEMSAAQLVEEVAKFGVDYDRAHAEDLRRLENSYEILADNDPTEFDDAFDNGQTLFVTTFNTLT